MKQIEIPLIKDRKASYRFFEMLPGILTWSILILPFVLALTNVRLAAYLMIGYLLLWFLKAFALNVRVLQGYSTLKQHEKVKWQSLIDDVVTGQVNAINPPKWHAANLERLAKTPNGIRPRDVVHAVIIATYNEAREVLEPTINAVLNSRRREHPPETKSPVLKPATPPHWVLFRALNRGRFPVTVCPLRRSGRR